MSKILTSPELVPDKLKLLTQRALGNYAAFLYDCDGTLADNIEAHKETYVAVALKAGVTIHPEIVDEFAGLPIPMVVQEINKRYNCFFDPGKFEEEKTGLFFKEFISKTKPVRHVLDHLKANAGKIKIGVVSGGSRIMVEKTLEVLGILKMVDVIVCAGETPRGKPFPDPFLKAAELLEVPPASCLVFEDGEPGVKSAEAAGMQWVRIDKL